MFHKKHEYFVAWIYTNEDEICYGSHLIVSSFKGKQLLDCMIDFVQKDHPKAVITSITKLK